MPIDSPSFRCDILNPLPKGSVYSSNGNATFRSHDTLLSTPSPLQACSIRFLRQRMIITAITIVTMTTKSRTTTEMGTAIWTTILLPSVPPSVVPVCVCVWCVWVCGCVYVCMGLCASPGGGVVKGFRVMNRRLHSFSSSQHRYNLSLLLNNPLQTSNTFNRSKS